MKQLEIIRNSIIDKLLVINNQELLSALNKILESKSEEPVKLTDAQKEMLQMSEEDIAAGRIYTQSEIDKRDAEWLD